MAPPQKKPGDSRRRIRVIEERQRTARNRLNNKSIAKPEAFGLTPDASGLSAPILVKSQSTFDVPLSRAKRKKKRAQSDRGLPPDDELRKLADGGVASRVNAKTGELHWIERLTGSYSASPIYVNERVLFLSETGLATWVQAGRQFAKSGENKVSGRTLATPAFFDGAMYRRTDEHLYKIAR